MSGGRRNYRRLAVYSGLISAIAVTLVVPVYLGHLLDDWWGTRPWLTLVGLLAGTCGAFLEVFRLLEQDRD